MPIYTYKCVECEKIFNVRHSMKEKYTHCGIFECDKNNALIKVLHTISVKKEKPQHSKVGSIVKKHIEDTKEEVKAEKEKMQKEEYKPE